MNAETKPETTPNFITLAEQAAMDKVMDVYKSSFLKHALCRFGPEGTMKTDRLKGIFKYGIISKDFARRIRVDYASNFHDQYNDKGVSVLVPERFISDAIGVAIRIQIWERYDTKVPIENVLVFLIKPNLDTYDTPRAAYMHLKERPEKLVAYRIPQGSLQGIVIIDSKKTSDSEGLYSQVQCQENIEWDSSTPLNTTKLIVKEMLSAYEHNPSFAIPVYGTSGALYWPRQMSYQEVQSFVNSRNP